MKIRYIIFFLLVVGLILGIATGRTGCSVSTGEEDGAPAAIYHETVPHQAS